jgi:hypothetical protein
VNCSLSKFYTMIASAIALLALAVVGALIPFNVVGLAISIASVLTVSIFLIPGMRAELRAFDTCMGPSTKCSVGPNIDLLGQVASIVSAVAFIAALALEVAAIAAIATVIFAWIGLTLEAGAALLKYSGIVASGAAGLILVGLLTNVRNYEACRQSEKTPPIGTGTGGLVSGTTAAGMLAELCAPPSPALSVQRGALVQLMACYLNTGTASWVRGSSTQVNLAAAPLGAPSPFSLWASNWLSASAYATTSQTVVAPGQQATFLFNMVPPLGTTPGRYTIEGELVLASTGARLQAPTYRQVVNVQ